MTDISKRLQREPFFMGGVRNVAQGLSVGFADEAEAMIRAKAEGRPYEEVLQEIRQSTSKYAEENPLTSVALQIAGGLPLALTPLGAGRGLAAAAKIGAAEGAVSGFGSGEGGLANRLINVPVGAAVGAVAAPVAEGATRLIGNAASGAVDWVRRNFGNGASRAFNAEIDRLVQSSGMSRDEIVQAVADGRLVSENQTLNAFARGYFTNAEGGQAPAIIKQGLEGRPQETRQLAEQRLLEGLTGQSDRSALMLQDEATQAVDAYRGQAYAPFKQQMVGPDVEQELLDQIFGTPSAGDELSRAYRTETRGGDLFARNEDGQITGFNRPLTVDDAERVRRSLNNAATREYTGGSGLAGGAVKEAEQGLRGTLDALYPDLKNVRENMAGFNRAEEAFTSGQKAATGDARQAEIDLLQIANDPQQLEAYRRGFMATIQRQLGTSRGAGAVRDLLSEERSSGRILRMIYPDNADDVIAAIGRAVDAQTASNKILTGSQTTETASQIAAQSGLGLTDIVDAVTMNPTAMVKAATSMIDNAGTGLTVAERESIARLLVERNPEVVRRALIDDSGWRRMQDIIEQTAAIMARGAGAGAASAGGQYGGDATEVMVPRQPLRLTIGGNQ